MPLTQGSYVKFYILYAVIVMSKILAAIFHLFPRNLFPLFSPKSSRQRVPAKRHEIGTRLHAVMFQEEKFFL